MWDSGTILMLAKETGMTLYMTLVSTILAYAIGLPMGIFLVITAKDGLKPNAVVYKILDAVVNIVRSIPFLILLMLLIPFTRFVVGKSYGATATIVPLTAAAAPFIARLVESSLLEVDRGVIGGPEHGGRNRGYRLESAFGGGQDFADCRCNHRFRNYTGLFGHGRCRGRRRPGRCGHTLRISPVSGGYYGSDCSAVNYIGSDTSVDRNQDFEENGQEDYGINLLK